MADERKDDEKPDKDKSGIQADLAKFLGLGMHLAVTVALFVALGWWLDNKFNSSPWAMIAAGMLGIAAGMYHFVKKTLK
ncbi:MAG TPA: AtpZ/AtpI family protein [Planctomycetota bacterium]|nr:AtpZ/AtpI family protein [Planctomycetota bacterium]